MEDGGKPKAEVEAAKEEGSMVIEVAKTLGESILHLISQE